MEKGKSEHAFYLKELMRLMPISYNAAKDVWKTERDLRQEWQEEKAEQFRRVKIALYDFSMDCRLRNGDLIERAALNSKERWFLRCRYVRAFSWRQLFGSQNYSPDHCKRIHRDAVAKIAKQHADVDYRPLYEQERARLEELLAQVGEKIR